MKTLLSLLLFLPIFLSAQTDTSKGIHFEQGLTWEQVKGKAKAENKYLFVDCYATWCGPCKYMDKEVYTNEKVGKLFNDKFISVKIQMDTTKRDNEQVKSWYQNAHSIMKEYNVTVFPTYLFFSPDGIIVHQGIGLKGVNPFIAVGTVAHDPEKQIYTLVRNYQIGKKNYSYMPYMAKSLRELKQKELAITIGQDYLQNYLYKMADDSLYTKENITFIGSYIQSSKEKGFNLFYKHSDSVDKIMNRKGISQGLVDYIISKEEINSKIWKDDIPAVQKPKWARLKSVIKRKYSAGYAERIVLDAQIRWYSYKKDWVQLANYQVIKIEKYGLDTVGIGRNFTNDMIWQVIFEHSNDPLILKKGIEWMEILKTNTTDPAILDTYANLLYKVGRIAEAIAWEEKAVKQEEENSIKNNTTPDKVFKEALEKMRKGEPTWPKD